MMNFERSGNFSGQEYHKNNLKTLDLQKVDLDDVFEDSEFASMEENEWKVIENDRYNQAFVENAAKAHDESLQEGFIQGLNVSTKIGMLYGQLSGKMATLKVLVDPPSNPVFRTDHFEKILSLMTPEIKGEIKELEGVLLEQQNKLLNSYESENPECFDSELWTELSLNLNEKIDQIYLRLCINQNPNLSFSQL